MLSTVSWLKPNMPTDAMSAPGPAIQRGSILLASVEAIPAPATMAAENGRNANPACSGPYPSTCWM